MISKITLEVDREFERHFQIGVFSKKFRIMMYVMVNPGCSLKDAQAESGLSSRGFHMKLKELIQAGLVTLDDDPFDGRRKRMSMGPNGLVGQALLRAPDSSRGLLEGSTSGYQPSLLGENCDANASLMNEP